MNKIEEILKNANSFDSPYTSKGKILARIREALREISGIPGNHTFASYDCPPGDARAKVAVMAMVDLTPDGRNVYELDDEVWENWKPPAMLTLYGGTGTGKTHLALAAGRAIIARFSGDSMCINDIVGMELAIYRQTSTLLNELRAGYNDNSFYDTLQLCKNCRLLILDDLGAEKATGWAQATLDEILDWRYSNQSATIITTNVLPNKLSKRIASRLQDWQTSKVFAMDCEDYRMLTPEKVKLAEWQRTEGGKGQ